MEPETLLTTPRFRVVQHLIKPRSGGPVVKREIIVHPGAVVILPMLDDTHVCLIRNHRIGVGKTLIELPAGTLEREEAPALTAVRELKEETGFAADRWQELPGFFASPGILNERMHLFVAQGLTPGEPAREPGEEIENLIVDWQEAVRMAESGQIEDAKSLVGILLWDRLKQKSQSCCGR